MTNRTQKYQNQYPCHLSMGILYYIGSAPHQGFHLLYGNCCHIIIRDGRSTYRYEEPCWYLKMKVSLTCKQQFTSELGTEWSIDFYIFIHKESITKYLNWIPYFSTDRCKIVNNYQQNLIEYHHIQMGFYCHKLAYSPSQDETSSPPKQ